LLVVVLTIQWARSGSKLGAGSIVEEAFHILGIARLCPPWGDGSYALKEARRPRRRDGMWLDWVLCNSPLCFGCIVSLVRLEERWCLYAWFLLFQASFVPT
ncbi:unnamed protein product, partial [Ixodes hexagonus]